MPPASQHLHSRIVQSRQNGRVKELRASLSSGARSEAGRVGIEGEHLLLEALRSGVEIATVFFRSGDEACDRIGLDSIGRRDRAAGGDLRQRGDDGSPQGIAALVAPKVFSLGDVLRGESPLVVIAAGLQDPGNLGTLIRSAEAFGASGVITLPGTVSQWNAKAMRASSGSVFRLPVVAAGEDEVFSGCDLWEYGHLRRLRNGVSSAAEAQLTGPVALLIGNEGRGLSPELLERSDERITVPCPGRWSR